MISLPPKGDTTKKLGSYFMPLKAEAQTIPNMTVKVSEGTFWTAAYEHMEYIGGTSPTISAPASDAKWVLVTVKSTGILNIIDGAASGTPELPDVSTYRDELPLAAIFVGDTTTAVTNDMIYDLRPLWAIPPDSVSQTQLNDFATITYVDNQVATKAEETGTTNANFTLNVGGGSINDSGIIVDRQAGPDVSIRFNETAVTGSPAVITPLWEFTNDGVTWNPIGIASGSYYTKTDLDTGALNFLYYTKTDFNTTGVLDSRYYEQTVADAAFSAVGHTHVVGDISGLSDPVLTVNSISPTAGNVDLSANNLLDIWNVAPADKHVLVYNNANSRYENRLIVSDDLDDFDTSAVPPVSGDALVHNGSKFVNRSLLKSDISNLTETDYVLAAGTAQDVFGIKTFKDGIVIETSLSVTGTDTSIFTTELHISDPHIDLNFGETGNGVTAGHAGIRVDRGFAVGSPQVALPNAILQWDDGIGQWEIGIEGSAAQILTTGHSHVVADLTDFVAGVTAQLGVNNLDTIQDVTYLGSPALAVGNVLQWTGSEWNNHMLIKSDISDFVEADYIHITGNETKTGDLTLDGNFEIIGGAGTTTIIGSEALNVADDFILINHGELGDGVAGGAGKAGISVDRGYSTGSPQVKLDNANFYWDELAKTWGAEINGSLDPTAISFAGHTHLLVSVTDVTVAAADVNSLDNVLSAARVHLGASPSVNVQILDCITRNGDAMDNGANLTFAVGGEVLGLPATPSATAASSKEYVDTLILPSSTHIADASIHITADQNAFLNGLNVTGSPLVLTSSDVNSLSGITSNVQSQLDLKANLITGSPLGIGNFLRISATGDIENSAYVVNDAGTTVLDIWSADQIDTTKADKVIAAVNGNIASLDASGNLLDSGVIAADVSVTGHAHVVADITDFNTGIDTYLTGTAVIDDVSDINAAGASIGDFLQRTGGSWDNIAPGSITDFVHATGSVAEVITGIKTFSDNTIFNGDLTINGTTLLLASTNLDVTDQNIRLNAGYAGATSGSTGSGLHIDRNASGSPVTPIAVLIWDDAISQFKAGIDGSETEILTTGSTASQLPYAPSGSPISIAATDVQAAINELDTKKSGTGHTHVEADITDLQSYLVDITAESIEDLSNVDIITPAIGEVLIYQGSPEEWQNSKLSAADVTFAPGSPQDIGSGNVQDALLELDTEKAPLASPVFTGVPELPTYTVGTLPAVGTGGGVIFVSDATGSGVTGSMCFSNGTSWIDPTTGIAVA